MKTFSYLDRAKNIDQMQNEIFDLVIIGGGITGAGIARDAASRSMKVALVEANDYAIGTSSRSSKLIHGGIRYLEQLEFHLVFEALSERRLLFETVPTLVHPLRFVLPIYRDSRVGMAKMGLGMWLYDILSLFSPEIHETLSPRETLADFPMLKKQGLCGSFAYSDGYMDDDRLTIETLRSAHALDACCANYVRVEKLLFSGEKVRALHCFDQLSQKSFEVRGRHFVSAVGPWTDEFARKLLPTWKPLLRPSKGIHITLSKDRLNLPQAVVMAVDREKRIVFGIPRHDMVIIGTTDTEYHGSFDEVYATQEDIRYLLQIIGIYFPDARITEDDIIMSYAGIRPLIADNALSAGTTSREHLVYRDHRNITFVAGGKYTTYRKMAQDTLAQILDNFSIEDQVRFANSNTRLPLNPLATHENLARARLWVPKWAQQFQQPASTISFLVERHGLETELLLEKATSLGRTGSLWELEALFAIECTMCHHLVDFYTRRVPLCLAYPDHGLAHLEPLADLFATQNGWSSEARLAEVKAVRDHINRELSWR